MLEKLKTKIRRDLIWIKQNDLKKQIFTRKQKAKYAAIIANMPPELPIKKNEGLMMLTPSEPAITPPK